MQWLDTFFDPEYAKLEIEARASRRLHKWDFAQGEGGARVDERRGCSGLRRRLDDVPWGVEARWCRGPCLGESVYGLT